MLLTIGSGATAGDALKDYSGQPGLTAAQHLLVDVSVPQVSNSWSEPSSGWGSSYSVGTGYIKVENGWYRATKVATTSARGLEPIATPRVIVEIPRAATRGAAFGGSVLVISKTYGTIGMTSCGAYSYDHKVSSSAEVACPSTSAFAEPGEVTWLSADEIVVILENMT